MDKWYLFLEVFFSASCIIASSMVLYLGGSVVRQRFNSRRTKSKAYVMPPFILNQTEERNDMHKTVITETVETMDFGVALLCLKAGRKVARNGWNGKGIFLELQTPDNWSKMTHPYIFIDTTGLQTDNPDAPKSRVPWLASQTDMLANDWVIVNDVL